MEKAYPDKSTQAPGRYMEFLSIPYFTSMRGCYKVIVSHLEKNAS